MKVNGNPIILFFACSWVLIFLSLIRIQSFIPSDVGFVFVIIIIQSFIFVLLSNGLFNQTYWVFSLIFFGVVPILEIEFNVRSYVGMPSLSDADLMFAGVWVFSLNIIYAVSYVIFKKRKISNFSTGLVIEKRIKSIYSEKKFFIISVLIGFACFVVVFNDLNNNIIALFFRGGDFEADNVVWTPQKLIIQRFIRPLPMLMFLSFFLFYGYKSKLKLLTLFLIALLVSFPTSLPRFFAAALYIPILFVLVPLMRRGLFYFYFLVFSLVFLFPALNSFRRYNSDDGFKLITASDFTFFIEGHFDSFQTFAQVTAHDIVRYGEQLILVFTFWVPRSFWEQKPISSGAEIGQTLGAFFTNMSANIYAEGWINFGMFGAVLFSLTLGFVASKIDSYFNPILKFNIFLLNHKVKLQILAYFFLSPLFFMTLRGDLVTAVANTLGFIAAWVSVNFLIWLLVKKKNVI